MKYFKHMGEEMLQHWSESSYIEFVVSFFLSFFSLVYSYKVRSSSLQSYKCGNTTRYKQDYQKKYFKNVNLEMKLLNDIPKNSFFFFFFFFFFFYCNKKLVVWKISENIFILLKNYSSIRYGCFSLFHFYVSSCLLLLKHLS